MSHIPSQRHPLTNRIARVLLLLATMLSCTLADALEPVRIGIIALRPKAQMEAQWQPLATALKRAIPERDFKIEALNQDEINMAVASRQLDFVLINGAHYIELADRYGLTAPLATLANSENGRAIAVHGGTIFVLADQRKINALPDLRGKTIATVSTESLGGYLMQAYELKQAGVNLPQDARLLVTTSPQDKAVNAVLQGKAEVGFVNNGVLESMAREGKLDLTKIRIINPQHLPDYPMQVSTHLYPMWPFAALPYTHESLARRVAAALFSLEEDTATTRAIRIQGFVVPADYSSVKALMQTLRVPPFDVLPEFTAQDVWQKYRLWIIFALIGSLAILSLGVGLWVLNRRLRKQQEIVKQKTLQLQENNLLLDSIVENIPNMVFLKRAEDLRFELFNRAGERLLGYLRTDLIGKNDYNFFPREQADSFIAKDRAVLAQTDIVDIPEEHIETAHGARILHTKKLALRNGKGQPVYLLGISEDITERKLAEAAMRMSEERLRLATTAGNIGVWDWDVFNNVLTWGESMYTLYGIRVGDFSGAYDAWTRTLHPDDRQMIEGQIQAAFRGEHEYAPEFRIVRTDGSVRNIKADSKTYFDPQGKAIRMVGINIDITERKQAEERFRQLFENMSSGAVVYRAVDGGEDFIFLDINSAVERIESLTRDELIGKRVTEAFPGIREMGLLEIFKRVWQSGQPEHYPQSFYADSKISGWRENFAYRLSSGELVVIYEDITERKQAEEALKCYKDHLEAEVQTRTSDLILARDAAEAANKAKSVFLTSINHELRTPLNAILGFSNLLRLDAQLRPEQRTNLEIINRSGEHLLTLINDVLEMAKIEAGKTQLNIAPLDFGVLVRDVADMVHIRVQEKGLRLLIDQSPDFPRYIKSDAARLRQVLINLVGNAIKFTQQGGITMRFGIKPNDMKHHIVIEIEDSGIGISAEDQQHLFQPFIQMGALPGDNKGTGLGLAITRQFVQLMGGTISVESTLGKGSIFRVELPFEEATPSGEGAGSQQVTQGEVIGLAPNQPSYRILIVEDQPENQYLLTKLMETIDLEVKVAEDGKQGVQQFQSWHPHLIFMDRRMPVMDGVEATRLIRQLPSGKEVKIVAVTASALSEERDEMLAAGMDDFVRKPYRFAEIYDSLSRQLGVCYTYAETPTAIDPPAIALSAEMLAILPSALRDELKTALESLDSDRICTVLEQIKLYDATLHNTLSLLADNFDYPAILKWL